MATNGAGPRGGQRDGAVGGSSQRSRDSSPSETTFHQWMKRERLGKCFRKSRRDRISTPRHPLATCLRALHTTQLHSGPAGRALAGSEKCHLHGRSTK